MQAHENGKMLLFGTSASFMNRQYFLDAKFEGRHGATLLVPEHEARSATLVPRARELSVYIGYGRILDTIVSPLAGTARYGLGLTSAEEFTKLMSDRRAVTIAGATPPELGTTRDLPMARYYSDVIYDRLAKGVAEAVAFGYDTMLFGRKTRGTRTSATGLSRKIDYDSEFLKHLGGAILWEIIRRYAEDLVGYTIRDQYEQEVAIRSREYGVEIFAKLEAGRDTRSKYGKSWYRLERGGQGEAAAVDGRTMWQTIPIHELPDVAYITLNMDLWRTVSQSGLLAFGGGAQKLILDWYHPKDPRSKVETFLPYREFWRYRKDGS